MEKTIQQKVVDQFFPCVCKLKVSVEEQEWKRISSSALESRPTAGKRKFVSLSLSPAPKGSKLEKKKGERKGYKKLPIHPFLSLSPQRPVVAQALHLGCRRPSQYLAHTLSRKQLD